LLCSAPASNDLPGENKGSFDQQKRSMTAEQKETIMRMMKKIEMPFTPPWAGGDDWIDRLQRR